MNTRQIGNQGENLAINYLIENGYTIIKQNFHFGKQGEIDIIARDADYLCFIEVKTRNNRNYGDPLSSITPSKVKKLRRTAQGYLYVNKIENQACRFDVVSIDHSGIGSKIELIQNAF